MGSNVETIRVRSNLVREKAVCHLPCVAQAPPPPPRLSLHKHTLVRAQQSRVSNRHYTGTRLPAIDCVKHRSGASLERQLFDTQKSLWRYCTNQIDYESATMHRPVFRSYPGPCRSVLVKAGVDSTHIQQNHTSQVHFIIQQKSDRKPYRVRHCQSVIPLSFGSLFFLMQDHRRLWMSSALSLGRQ